MRQSVKAGWLVEVFQRTSLLLHTLDPTPPLPSTLPTHTPPPPLPLFQYSALFNLIRQERFYSGVSNECNAEECIQHLIQK